MSEPSLPCRARIGMQADAVRAARAMAREFPLSPPNPSPKWRGERRAHIGLSSNMEVSIGGDLPIANSLSERVIVISRRVLGQCTTF